MSRPVRNSRARVGCVAIGGLFLCLCGANVGSARDAIERLSPSSSAYPDAPLEQIEERLAVLLGDFSYMPEATGRLAVRIDGCVAVISRDFGSETCADAHSGSIWKWEKYIDLQLLKTDPRQVVVRSARTPRTEGAAGIRIPVKDRAAERIAPMSRAYSLKVRREIADDSERGVYDLPARMDRLRAFSRDVLTDRLFERLGKRTHFCTAGVNLAPDSDRYVFLLVAEHSAVEIVELLHAYALRACQVDRRTLEPRDY